MHHAELKALKAQYQFDRGQNLRIYNVASKRWRRLHQQDSKLFYTLPARNIRFYVCWKMFPFFQNTLPAWSEVGDTVHIVQTCSLRYT